MDIHVKFITTKAGNTLSMFYNPDLDLLVIDLVAENEKAGNELVRMTLNETELLKHMEYEPEDWETTNV